MSTDTQENKLFSFDGKNICLYQYDSNGELERSHKKNEKLGTVTSTEHAAVGDIAFEIFFKGIESDDQKLIEQKLTETGLAEFRKSESQLYVDLAVGSQKIRAGMIVALGGYYSLPDEPIGWDIASPDEAVLSMETVEKRFLAVFQTLVRDKKKEVPDIVKQIGWEGNTIHGMIKRKAQPSIVMGMVNKGKITWANVTSRSLGWRKHIPGGFFIGRYVQSATMNFDHFGLEAETAYEAGHRLALKIAADASILPDKDVNKWHKWAEALSAELFACHFFADLFVSGHVRTPRRKVFEILNNARMIKKKWIAALFANLMHDEDNEKGVYVCSERHPSPWEAMGDYRYSDDGAGDENEKYVHHAVAARLRELYQVFRQKTDWHSIVDNFKKDIPREATPAWLAHCQCPENEARARALAHTQKFQPFLRIGAADQLEVRPDYRPLSKKTIMSYLAKVLARGIEGEVKAIIGNTVKEISRITPVGGLQNWKGDENNQLELSSHTEFAEDSLERQILAELYLMDQADEVIVGIETPRQEMAVVS